MKLVTTKITERSLQLLRLIAAQTGKLQYEALESVLEREWEWVQRDKKSSKARR